MKMPDTTSNTPLDAIADAIAALQRLEGWIQAKVQPLASPEHAGDWRRWQRELQSIRESLDRPQSVQVALVGTTGAGKSTLLNALLGVQLLQVGVASSITSFVTRVRFADEPGYRVEIDYSTREEWAAEVERFIKALEPGEDDGDGEARSIVNNLRKRVEAVHAAAVPEGTDASAARRMPLAPDAEQVFAAGGHSSCSFDDTKSMVQYLRSVVKSDSPIWPLVKQVSISGPFEMLRGGVELVDLPGTNDLNDARVDVTRDFIRNAPFVWLVFSMKRGITADGRTMLEREKILRTLVLSGSFNSLQLIGTHADDIDLSTADQFGLDPDTVENADLIAAYRKHFVDSARPVLLEVVDSLIHGGDDPATAERMRALAREAPIHAVSARAYNQMAEIVRSNVDFGLKDVEQTGIPEVHRALRQIADEVGAGLTGRTAQQRMRQLHGEILTFFRGKAAAGSPAAARAKAQLDREVDRLAAQTDTALIKARSQLEERRKAFLARVQPMLDSSVKGVARKTEEWRPIHWGTLRAIVNRDGVFKSPSSGRRYDLNEDVVDALLNQLPVVWEGYFTTELGAVRDHLAQRLEDFTEDFIQRARTLSADVGGASQDLLDRQLSGFRERIGFERQQCELNVGQRVAEIRREASNGMVHTVKQRMLPAYERAADERGPGVKARMLDHLQPSAVVAAGPIFANIQRDLIERLTELESMVGDLFAALERVCVEQAAQVAGNVNLDINEAQLTPALRALLSAEDDGWGAS